MADLRVFTSQSTLQRLPAEIWHQIFEYVYPRFYLRYTQVHDHLPSPSWEVRLEAINVSRVGGQPLLDKLPHLGPLLVNKLFRDMGYEIFKTSFTSCVHVIGKLIWREVHKSYAGLMLLSQDLIISEEDLWSFFSLKFIDKLPQLKRVTFLMGFRTSRVLQYELVDQDVRLKALGLRTIDGIRWLDITANGLFDALNGQNSELYRTQNFWVSRKVRPVWRWSCYAVIDREDVQNCRDLIVIDFEEEPDLSFKLTHVSLHSA